MRFSTVPADDRSKFHATRKLRMGSHGLFPITPSNNRLFCLHIVFGTISCMADEAQLSFRSGYALLVWIAGATYVLQHIPYA